MYLLKLSKINMNKRFIITLVSALLSGHISTEASSSQYPQNRLLPNVFQLSTDVYRLTDEQGNRVFNNVTAR